jgi:hypothetical protein
MSKVVKAVGKAVSSTVKAVGKVVTSVVKAAVRVVKAVIDVVASVVAFVAQPFMGMLGGAPDVPDAGKEAERQQGVLVQTQGSNIHVPVIYGYRKVGGTVVFAETGSTNNKYLYVAYVFSEGPLEGLREVFIDDWQLPVEPTGSLNAGQVVDINADRYKGRVRLQWYPGAYFSDPTQSPVGNTVKNGIFAEAPSFMKEMVFNGLAVMFARYEWKEIKTQEDSDNNPFGGNIPQLQISVLGRRVASLLVDTENTTYDQAPVRYSTNPAEILLDYLRNPRYGKGLVNGDIDWDSWKRAARKCNQTVTYLTEKSNITGPILTCNYVLDTSATIFSNTKTLLMGFRGYMPYVQGKYKLKIEDAGNEFDILSGSATIYQTFTKDDIVGDVSYTGIERSNKYNVVAVNYVDPDQKFSVQQVIYPETLAERQRFIDLDGGRENRSEATFPTITNYAIAKDMARLLFNKSRRQETCSLTVTSRGMELEPGDNIRIQSNILDFGEDPWRVISMKINNDMSVELNCVRNPDDIYPHVRVGEEDWVLPLYVPRGSIIYYPSSDNRVALGLVPPTNAIFPEDYNGTATHPPSTNPALPPGGGVGGNETSGPILPPEEPPIPAPIPVPPVNNVPVAPPPPPEFSAVLRVKRSSFNDFKNGTSSFSLVFEQPQIGLYSYSIVWWRVNKFSPWQEVRLDTLPGPGGDIPWTLGPLPGGLYDFYARCFATDGRASDTILQGQLGSRYDLIQLGQAGLLGVATVKVTEGWSLPASEVATAPRYNSDIDFLTIRPKLVSNLPQDPRRLTLKMQQILNTLNTPINTLISGVRVYYKLYSDTYYSYEEFRFPPSYIAGQVVEFDLAGDFGQRVYPNPIVVNTAPSLLQYYDFVIRLVYENGVPAERQLKKVRAPVEVDGLGNYNFAVYGQGTDPVTGTGYGNFNEAVTAGFNSSFLTVDQDPNRGVVTGTDILASFYAIFSDRNSSRVTWNFNAVTNSRFRGFKIRYRPVTVGENPPFSEVTIPNSVNAFNLITYVLQAQTYQHNQTYDWVVTAQVSTPSGIVDSPRSLVSRTRIQFEDPESTSLVNKFNFKTQDTELALGQLRTAFPGVPVINPKAWIKGFDDGTTFGPNIPPVDVKAINNQYYLNHWYTLRFQAPSATTAIIVYRRVYDSVGASRSTTAWGGARYYGLGRWERVRVPISNLPTDSEGWRNLNVRGPLSPAFYNRNFETQSGAGRYDPYYFPAWPNNATPSVSGAYPYAGVGHTFFSSSTAVYQQYLFVLELNNVMEDRGLMLRDFRTNPVSNVYQKNVDGFTVGNVPKDNIVLLSTLNTFPNGYERNLNEAINAVAYDKLINANGNTRPAGPPPVRSSGSAVYNRFILQPVNGTTVVY